MRTSTKAIAVFTFAIAVASLPGPAVRAGSHTWDVWEVFSNADGTVQFIELHEANGGNTETGLAGHQIIANPSNTVYTMLNNVPGPTGNKYYLLATAAFAALPGAPTPNEIIPANFIKFATDSQIQYTPWDVAIWTAGTLPTNGITSLERPSTGAALAPSTNSPTNYAGATGSIDASGGGPSLPGVPDGVTGPPMTIGKLASDGSSLSITWNTATCSDANDHQVLYGQKTGLPATLGGTYTLLGGRCDVGSVTPFTWNPTPNAVDGNGLIWFLLVTENDAGTEGPWGDNSGGNDRTGPGTGGSSNVCGTAGKNVSNACGH